jgi:hypothetical protein
MITRLLTRGGSHRFIWRAAFVVVVQAKKPFFLMLCEERIGLRYYDFAQEGASSTFSRGEKKQNLNSISAEGHFLACLKFCSLVLSFEERMLFCVVLVLLAVIGI